MSTATAPKPGKRVLPPLIKLSDSAAARLRDLYKKGDVGNLLRISVKAKGCSGLSYDMSWVSEPAPTDEIVNDNGLQLLVDRKASLSLIGTIMNYETSGFGAGFTFVNPNEKGRCGCGESFHV